MIKAITDQGELDIETTEIEWSVEYDNQTWGTTSVIECADEAEARMFAGTLVNSRLMKQLVLISPKVEVAQ